ncbi:hypothetical protein DL95DRAFT_418119 [Leptodontidium sp. 2 PMI_412]|nr:hypothetical protein DL95DRAFT_418119 [Leptodontidium sp. 2 PMI_412]
MSAYINLQVKPTEYETRSYRPKVKAEEREGDDEVEGDDGKEGEDESEAKDEKEGCGIIALLKESIKTLKGLLLCGNEDEVEDELYSRKLDSHVPGQSETALQRCLGLLDKTENQQAAPNPHNGLQQPPAANQNNEDVQSPQACTSQQNTV